MTKIAASEYQKVADMYASGMTQSAVGAEFGVTQSCIRQILIALGVEMRPGGNKSNNHIRVVPADQHRVMAEMYKAGSPLSEVGAKYGVTRERARQIVAKFGLSKFDGGSAIRSLKKISSKASTLRAKSERMEARCRAAWGMSLDDYHAHVAEYGSSRKALSPMRRYIQQRRNALGRGIEWKFTFAEWWRVWQESGKWDERGRTGYVMARYGDGDAPYSPATVYICTQQQNIKDSFIVYPDRRAGVRIASDERIARVQQMREKNPPGRKSKLTADEVKSIRNDSRSGSEIAATYGICPATVSQIRTRKIWKHV